LVGSQPLPRMSSSQTAHSFTILIGKGGEAGDAHRLPSTEGKLQCAFTSVMHIEDRARLLPRREIINLAKALKHPLGKLRIMRRQIKIISQAEVSSDGPRSISGANAILAVPQTSDCGDSCGGVAVSGRSLARLRLNLMVRQRRDLINFSYRNSLACAAALTQF
jgi:hypothetical protein